MGLELRWALGLGSTCPIFHILHLHDFSVDSTPEDVEGAIDGLGPLGGFLAPGDPERQQEVNNPYVSPNGLERAKGSRAVIWKGARGWQEHCTGLRSMGFQLQAG